MIMMRSLSRMMSPVGLLIGGSLLVLSLPPVRRALRSAAVHAVAGVLILSERVQNMASSGREEIEDIVMEAKMSQFAGEIDASINEEDHINNKELI